MRKSIVNNLTLAVQYLFSSILFILIYSTSYSQGIKNFELLYHWEDTSLPATIWHNNTYNEVWGVNANGREFAIIGSTNGTHFFDITHEDSIEQVAYVPGAHQGVDIVHRDYHDYKGYLYAVSDEGASTLQIMDLSYLPDSVHVVYDSDSLIITTHNIFIDTSNGTLFSCGEASPGVYKTLGVYSLNNSIVPKLEYSFTGNMPFLSTHDIYVKNGIGYINAGFEGLFVYDFNIPSSPVQLATYNNYPWAGYNHSGWTTEDQQYYMMIDETHGSRVKFLNVEDPADVQLESTFWTGIDSLSIAHNVIIRGNLAYVSYYYDGIRVYNISNPQYPVQVAYFDTVFLQHKGAYEGVWGVFPYFTDNKVIISDMQQGLYVLQLDSDLVNVNCNSFAIQTFNENGNGFSVTYNSIPDSVYLEYGDSIKKWTVPPIGSSFFHDWDSEYGLFNVKILAYLNGCVLDTSFTTFANPVSVIEYDQLFLQYQLINDQLSILFNESYINGNVSILDQLGHEVSQKQLNSVDNISFDVSHLPSGVYILTVNSDKGIESAKIFID